MNDNGESVPCTAFYPAGLRIENSIPPTRGAAADRRSIAGTVRTAPYERCCAEHAYERLAMFQKCGRIIWRGAENRTSSGKCRCATQNELHGREPVDSRMRPSVQ